MFGYIKPMTGELKVREHELYKSIYCGLCHAMGKHICTSNRFTLSYDIVFLALVRAALTDEPIHVEKKSCIAHPLQKRNQAFIPKTLEYCSKASALLTYYNLLDDVNDTGKLRYKLLLPTAKKGMKKADSDELSEIALKYLKLLSKSEKGSGSLDVNAEYFGKLLGEFFSYGMENCQNKYNAYKIGYHCGKWIYIMDAADDFEKDKATGEYNPLSGFDPFPASAVFNAATLELSMAWKTFDSAQINNKALYSIINNILRLGMPEIQDKIIKERTNDRSL